VVETRPAASSLAIHKGFINSLAFSGDGKKLATAGQDSVLRVYELPDCRLLTSLSGHEGFVECLAWSPGKVLASGGADKLVRLWDTDAGSLKHTLPVDDRVSALGWAADGKALLIATTDGKLRAWDAASTRMRFTIDADPYGCWSPDGRFVATYRWGQPAVRIWDAETGKLARAFPVHMKVGTLAWSPDGTKLAVNGCDDNCFWVLDALKGTVLRKSQRAPAGIFIRVAWSPDGQLLATAHEHSFIMLWNPATGEPIRNLGRHEINSSIPSLIWSPDGETVASASTDRSVRIWSILGEMPALRTLRGTRNE
jgi:WD40 repeat protein